ncbi:MAG: hypothetical protein NTU73_10090 [Ignavibacteriae bacterium]|nr:hypothetical protein [Ignavibacteriota bacterium]
MKKEEAKHYVYKISEVFELDHHFKEISGTVEQPDTHRTAYLRRMFGTHGHPIVNKEKYEKDCQEFLDWLPELMTKDNIQEVMAKKKVIFEEHIPVHDQRTNLAQNEERAIKSKEFDEKRKIESETKENELNLFHPERERITREEDEMFITISACFDDSDIMTDYFNRHSGLSSDYAIAKVPKQARKEFIVRNIIAQLPEELQKLKWEWHVEEYSMGHGTYMQSEVVAVIKHGAYNGRKEVGYHYELEFDRHRKELPKSRFFVEMSKELVTPIGGNEDITVRKNESKGGVEVIFKAKPDETIIEKLKSNGFRWSRAQRLWWARYTDTKYEFACQLQVS